MPLLGTECCRSECIGLRIGGASVFFHNQTAVNPGVGDAFSAGRIEDLCGRVCHRQRLGGAEVNGEEVGGLADFE